MSFFKKDKPIEKNQAAVIYKQFENVKAYKDSMGFERDWKKYIDFVEDRQWIHTDANKNIPKPMFNIIKLAKKTKTSAILSDTIKMMFSPVEQVDDSDIAVEASNMLNDAAAQTIEEIEQDRLDYEVVNDAFSTGTGFVHYYWDNKKIGGYKTKYIGSMDGETIDSMNIFPGNPQEKDVNKQPFWILTYRDMVEIIKKKAKEKEVSPELIESIVGDKDTAQEQYDASKFEVLGEEKTTVYVKYWRDLDDGKIYFCKSTKSVLFQPKEELWDYKGDDVEPYPIAYLNWEDRKKSIFGIGEPEGMIYNQKVINFIPAMQILNIQDTGWTKYIVKNDALQQKMQNIPGEVIQDVSGVAGDNIKPMQPAQMSNQAFQLLDNVIDNTRTFNGVSESVTGESLGANMAASAIIALQNQAKVPLDANRKKFYRYRKDVGKIMEFFYKCKYNLPRMINRTDENGNKSNVEFTGTKYNEVPLNLKITIGAGSSYSESLSTSTLQMLYDKGAITALQFAELASDNVMPFKEQFIKMKEKEQADQLIQATKALEQNQSTIQKLQMQLQQVQGGMQNGNVQQMSVNPQM